MGTLKLNKKIENNGAASAVVIEKSVAKKSLNKTEKQVVAEVNAEDIELCELAKQDEGFVEELKDLRTESETVYKRNDRTRRKIITSAPTRYCDTDGELKEISNRLIDNGTEILNEANSFKVKFNKDVHNGRIFDLQKGKKTVSLSAAGTSRARSHACGCKCELCSGKDNAVTATLNDGTEIEYVTMSDRVKENIIVKERQDSYEYNFTLNIGDLAVEEGELNNLLLKDKETGETQFIIPAPYMFDANEKRSDKVSYEIDVNSEELEIRVVADAEFINADECAFPVIIDPQVIVNNQTHSNFFNFETTCDQSDISDYYQDMLKIEYKPLYDGEYWMGISFDPRKIEGYNKAKSIKLQLTSKSNAVGYFKIDGTVYEAKSNFTYLFDITNKDASYQINLTFQALGGDYTFIEFFVSGEFAPSLILELPEEDEKKTNIKEIALSDKVVAYLDLNNGELCTQISSFLNNEFALPIGITHVHKAGSDNYFCGKDWRLNLNKKLSVSPKDSQLDTIYSYIDDLCNEWQLEEKYYRILPDGTKKYISKNFVDIDINGNLTFNGEKVYKLQSRNSITLIPEINDYINADLIEQRQSEHIQLEETVKSYERSFKNLVVVESKEGTARGNTVKTLEGFDKENFDLFIAEAEKSETYLIMQKSEAYQLKSQDAEQIELLTEQREQNLEYIKENFVNYLKKKRELEAYTRQLPENYLREKDGIISGYNSEGKLVCIFDGYGNVASLEYDSDGLLTGIYEGENKVAEFTYVNGLLRAVTDSRGRKVQYGYDSAERLTSVTYPDGQKAVLTYTSANRIATLTTDDGVTHNFTYSGTKLSRYTAMKSIQTISNVNISFNANNSVTLTDDKGQSERYKFDADNKVTQFVYIDEYERATTKNYTYEQDGKKVTCVTSNSVDDNSSVTEIKQYNDFGLLLSEEVDWRQISEKIYEHTAIFYHYAFDNKVAKKITIKYQKLYHTPDDDEPDCYDQTMIEKYSYDNHGNLTLTESYVEGEEKTSGVNFEERVYNDDGNMVKCIRWNSLDSSTKFYEECEREKDGRVKYDKDETGAYSAMYEYADGTNLVNAVTYPDGGKLAYGRNPYNNQITSVTKSTADGEANTNDVVYRNGLPVKVTSGNTTLEYVYDLKGRKTEIKVNGKTQVDYIYNDDGTYDGKKNFGTVVTRYAGGEEITESKTGVLSSKGYKITEATKIGGVVKYSREYDEMCRLKTETDSVSGTKSYTYDEYNNLTQIAGGRITESYTYDDYGELSTKTLSGEVTQTYSYAYKNNAARDLDYISFGSFKFKPLTDVNGRNTGKEIYSGSNKVAAEYITYRKVGDHATNMPATVWFGSGSQIKDSIKYKYDSCGNISEITQNGHVIARYTYDQLNRLIREDNKPLDKTVIYTYDSAGNITEKCKYAYTEYSVVPHKETDGDHYSYDYEGDKLISYKGEACVYNKIGNPTLYRGNDCLWQYATRLTKYGDKATFEYDSLGRRVKKITDGVTIGFTYDSDGRLIRQSNGLEFIYDNTGVVGVKIGGATYYYRKDIQGNIIAVLKSDGTVEAEYFYDAWGKNEVKKSNGDNYGNYGIGALNPFRYRGYYYDKETELYYLQSRYYDPEVGRFISQDNLDYADPETINGLNLYAYCGNNPVMNVDPTGGFAITAFFLSLIIGIGMGAAIGGTVSGVTAYKEGRRGLELFASIAGGIIVGGAMGAVLVIGGAAGVAATGATVAGFGLTTAGALGVSAAIGAGANLSSYLLINGIHSDKEITLGGAFVAMASGAFQAVATFRIGYMGGKNGLFNNLGDFKAWDTFYLNMINATGKLNLLTRLFYNTSMLLGNTLTKALYLSSSATGIRALINYVFNLIQN